MILLIWALSILLVCFILFIVVHGYGSFRKFLYFGNSTCVGYNFGDRKCMWCRRRHMAVMSRGVVKYWKVFDEGCRKNCGCLRFVGREGII